MDQINGYRNLEPEEVAAINRLKAVAETVRDALAEVEALASTSARSPSRVPSVRPASCGPCGRSRDPSPS